jgi:hypothetical protein
MKRLSEWVRCRHCGTLYHVDNGHQCDRDPTEFLRVGIAIAFILLAAILASIFWR